MAIIKSSVFHVLEKFPERGEDIKRLYTKTARNFKPFVKITDNVLRPCTIGINQIKKRRRPAGRNMSSCFRNWWMRFVCTSKNQFKKDTGLK
jgi:hypothetical protein